MGISVCYKGVIISVVVFAVTLYLSLNASAAEFVNLGRSDPHGISADGNVVVGRKTFVINSEAFRWTEESGVSDLGSRSAGFTSSYAFDLSSDGGVVVGYGNNADHQQEAFRWSKDDGMVSLGYLPGGYSSIAYGVSADGNVIFGRHLSSLGQEAFRWTTDDGMIGLGDLPGSSFRSEAFGISADGGVIVGESRGTNGTEAFRWTEAGGMIGLGGLSGSLFSSVALAVSGNGNVIVGSSYSSNGREAFRWTETSGMIGLGDLSGGYFSSEAFGVSTNGSVVIGESRSENGTEAFRWTEDGGMIGLGDLPGGVFYSQARDVSGDGSIIVGHSAARGVHTGSNDWDAFIWTEADGMQSILQLLIDDGVDMGSWVLSEASYVSDDGTTIVGEGNQDGHYILSDTWMARLGSGLISPVAVHQSVSTLLPSIESAHGLARESLDIHLMASRHYNGKPGASFNLYASGFGGEWNSYTAGGTIGLAWNLNDNVRLGTGLFTSTYNENDLAYSGEYELDALGATIWAGYKALGDGLQLHAVGLLADLDNEIERGYQNGAGQDKSKGEPGGDMLGLLFHLGWMFNLGEGHSLMPFASYSWTDVEIDGYTETGGGFPAHFDSRQDNSEVLKVGLESEYKLSESIDLWGHAAYGKRLDDNSTGITGEIVGLMDFAIPGFTLDDDWLEADLGLKWQASSNMSVMLTGGSAFGNDQNPSWRTSLGVTWSIM